MRLVHFTPGLLLAAMATGACSRAEDQGETTRAGDATTSVALELTEIGRAQVSSGRVIHNDGLIVAVGYDFTEKGEGANAEVAYSPLDDLSLPIPTAGTVIEVYECGQDPRGAVELPVAPEETVVRFAHGEVGDLSEATVAIVVDASAIDTTSILPYAPLHLRIFHDEWLPVNVALGDGIFACSIILDDLDGKAGNEIAVTWASIGNNYTIGVTVFSLREEGR